MSALRAEWLDWPETKKLIAAFDAAKVSLRFVGGAVRDTLLERQVIDVDAATPLVPDGVMALLEKSGIRALPTGIAHGTVTALIGKKHFEITTLRRDVDTDGRHATVSYTDDWQEDAKRRDFTMNALYLTPEGEMFDYFHGSEDAKAGRVRFIGDAATRIAEDYLRILRFFRFFAWFGKNAPDAEALTACAQGAPHIKSLSGERTQQELFKLLTAAHAAPALQYMQELGILDQAIGVKTQSPASLEKLEQRYNAMPILKFATLLGSANDLVTVKQRLKLSNADAERLQFLLTNRDAVTPGLSLKEQKKYLRKWGAELFIQLAQWSGSDSMITLAREWQPPLFPLTGNDLLLLGIKPGKQLGELLQHMEHWWEEEDYRPDKAALLARARNLRP
jgi:poly(A) polymerase